MEDEDALVSRGDIERHAEGAEVGHGSGGLGFFRPVFFGDGIESIGEASTASEGLVGASSAAGETFFAIWREDAEGGVCKAPIKVGADDFLILFGAVGVDADADELAGRCDDFFVAELTVLRVGVAGSEDAGNATALGGDRHEEDGLVRALRFGKALGELRIPSDPGIAEREVRFAEISRAWTLSVGEGGEGEE